MPGDETGLGEVEIVVAMASNLKGGIDGERKPVAATIAEFHLQTTGRPDLAAGADSTAVARPIVVVVGLIATVVVFQVVVVPTPSVDADAGVVARVAVGAVEVEEAVLASSVPHLVDAAVLAPAAAAD